MKEIIIRTNFNNKIGLGHFFRCKILKEKFEKKKYKVTFIIDNNNKKITKKIKTIALNSKKFNYLKDAKKVHSIIKNKKIFLIIVDSYLIDYKWERFLFNKGYKILVIDDLANRRHHCHYLVDSTSYDKEISVKRYAGLLNNDCKLLTGPNYKIISSKIKKINKTNFNIMIYFGGGFYLNFYISLINLLLKKFKKLRKKIKIYIVCTKFSNTDKIKKNYSFVKLIKDNFNLAKIINNTSLYIGSNSSIVNELTYLRIPRLLIAMNKKQNIDVNSYQKFGNYICINYPNRRKQNKIANLAVQLIKKYKRIKKLFSYPMIRIDNNGADRIVNFVLKK